MQNKAAAVWAVLASNLIHSFAVLGVERKGGRETERLQERQRRKDRMKEGETGPERKKERMKDGERLRDGEKDGEKNRERPR